jgi:hypothetical protein
MRSALTLATLALFAASPAFAATNPSSSQQEMQGMAETFNDPVAQEAMSGAFSGMMSALLSMRIDGIAKAIEPMSGGKKLKLRGNTLREMAMRDDPNFERKLQGSTKAMVGSMGAMMSAFAQIMPQMEEAMKKMEGAMPNNFK